MGEQTILIQASSKGKSLRTTLPMSLVKQFELKEGDRLDWKIQAKGDKLIIVVSPVKNQDNKEGAKK